jgi:hypothetical protein
MVPREVPASATVTLDHDAYLGRVCGDGFAVASRTGALTVLDDRLRTVRRVDLGGPVSDLSISGDRWARLVSDRLWVDDVPLGDAGACRWSPSGQTLWVATSVDGQVRVESRTPDGQVQRTVTVPGSEKVRLRHHPHPDAVLLWLTDDEQSWEIRDDGTTLTATHLPADDCLPALFGPDWLLAAGDALTRVSWPGGLALGTLTWADIDPDAEKDGSDAPGGCLMALPGGLVSWSTNNGRLRTIDPLAMTVVEEITLAGHPVRTVADFYPDLPADNSPCCDFMYAVPHPNGTVLSVHGEHTLVLSRLRDWSP